MSDRLTDREPPLICDDIAAVLKLIKQLEGGDESRFDCADEAEAAVEHVRTRVVHLRLWGADAAEAADRAADENAELRARVADLEAPGECASVHKLRAMVREAARLAWCDGLLVMSGGNITRADAIADRLLRGEHGGPDAD